MDVLRVIGSLVLVFGLLGGLLWGLRRLQSNVGKGLAGRRLQLLETLSVGPRQKVALVRVGQRQVLLGVSPMQITPLGQWPDDGEPAHPAHATPLGNAFPEVRDGL